MYLPRTSCIICGEHITKIKYNLKTTYSEKSNQLLIKLVEHVYKNISFLHCNICTTCYGLLNELDSIKVREKELYTQLKDHISKLKGSNFESDLSAIINGDDYICDTLPSSLPSVHHENHNATSEATFEHEEDINIPNIDLKKLPIKVKRIATRNINHGKNVIVAKIQSIAPTQKDILENAKAFEQIQSSIQMDLSKHIEENLKCKPIKNILCEICGQNLKTKSGFENHLKKHDDVEDEIKLLALNKLDDNWPCNVCGKIFNQKTSLSRHLIIHSGETRYQCEECGKKFIHHSSFNMHRKIHAGERNYKCKTCKHRFLTNSHLTRHIRSTHKKEKKYSCEICGKKFTENYNLSAHMKTVHPEDNAAVGIEQVFLEDQKSEVYYEILDDSVIKTEALIHIEENPTTVLYSL